MKKERTNDEKLEFLTDFCEKNNIPFTVNRNPSPEEIARIKGEIKRKEEIIKQHTK
jgi:hypothetical protein